jgi:hypothetical protein
MSAGRSLFIVTEKTTEQKAAQKKKKPVRNPNGHRQPILPTAIYTRLEAAQMVGCSVITLIRAYSAGHLTGYRQGRLIKHSGNHLINWLESGGKTGWRKCRANR